MREPLFVVDYCDEDVSLCTRRVFFEEGLYDIFSPDAQLKCIPPVWNKGHIAVGTRTFGDKSWNKYFFTDHNSNPVILCSVPWEDFLEMFHYESGEK